MARKPSRRAARNSRAGGKRRLEPGAVVHPPGQPQVAEIVLVVVMGRAVEPEAEAHAVAHVTLHGRDAGAHPQVGRGVDRYGDAAFGQQGAFLFGQMDAVRHGEPRREQADLVQKANDPLPVGGVEPPALARRFEQMHMDPPAVQGGGLGDSRQRFVPAPLRADRAVLDLEQRRFRGHCCDLLDLLDLAVCRRRRGQGGLH